MSIAATANPSLIQTAAAVPADQAQPARRENPRAKFPTAERLLRFIKAARDSQHSPIRHLKAFYAKAESETAGPWWKECHEPASRDATQRQPINPLGEAVRTYHPHLIGDGLAIVTEPSGLGDRGSAKMLEYRMRQWADDAGYQSQDERSVLDSILACSFMYVSRREGGQAIATEEGTLDMGQPTVQRISCENMVVTPNMEMWDLASEIGHFFPVDRQALLDAGIGNRDLIESLPNIWEQLEETKGTLRYQGGAGDEDQYLDDKIGLWEFCFMHAGRRWCCTLPPINGGSGFVVDPYPIDDGEPEGSRYVVTQLNFLPNHPMPISPAMVLMDSHLGKRAVVAKLYKQAEDLQRKYVVAPGSQDMVMRLKDSGGDDYVFGDPDKIKEFIQGGMLKELVEVYAFLETLGQKVGPNLDLMGGRDDPSKSATVGSILAGNGAVAMGYWKRKIDEGRTKVLRRVAAMLLQGGDQRTFMFSAANGQQIPVQWDAANLDISYDQYRYKVKPTSNLDGMDARAKLRSLVEVITVLPQAMQVLCGLLGAEPQKVLRVISDLSAMPQLDEMLPSGDMQGIQQQLFQMLAQNGQAKPVSAAAPMGAAPQLPQGPQTKVGQMNSDVSAGIPA